MKPLMICFICITSLSSCDLFRKSDEFDFGVCSEELFDRLEENGYLRVIAEYDMEYSPDHSLNDIEREEQRNKIQEMHTRLLLEMVGLTVESIRKYSVTPKIALSLDSESLFVLCRSNLIKSVEESRIGRTY